MRAGKMGAGSKEVLRSTVTSATLQQFAHAKDAVAAVAGKLEKQRILAEYFRELEDDDLRLAVRFAAGRAFPGRIRCCWLFRFRKRRVRTQW